MAAKAYRFKTVTFNATSITDVVDVSESESADATDHKTDNDSAVAGVWLDNHAITVSVTSTDQSLRQNSNFQMGDVGALVIVKEQRADGLGAVAAADITTTYAEAVCLDITEGSVATGEGSVVFTFRVYDSAGDGIVAHS